MRRVVEAGIVLAGVMMLAAWAWAEEETAGATKAPPLPCMTIEGTGGVFITPTAYLVNPSSGKDWLGMPSAVFNYASIGDKNFASLGVAVTAFKRLELSYSHEWFDLGEWPDDVRDATGLKVGTDAVQMDTFNLRGLLVEESGWIPAVTAGVTFKQNEDITDINEHLLGTVTAIGVDHDHGFEFTLTASKTFTNILPRPFILSAGLRNTGAAQTGLLGFTDDRDTVVEANAIFFITDKLLLAGEWRQKPDQLKRIAGLVEEEDDWFTVCGAYIVNEHMTVAAGWGHFGKILNDDENGVWAVHVKYEF